MTKSPAKLAANCSFPSAPTLRRVRTVAGNGCIASSKPKIARQPQQSGERHDHRLAFIIRGWESVTMADDPAQIVLHQLREMRAEIKDGFEKSAAEVARIHADVGAVKADIARTNLTVTQMHADVLATKSLVLDVVIKLTALEKRVQKLEDA
jgi:hypothetical protein